MIVYCPTCCHGSLYTSMFVTLLLALAGPMAAYSGYRINTVLVYLVLYNNYYLVVSYLVTANNILANALSIGA